MTATARPTPATLEERVSVLEREVSELRAAREPKQRQWLTTIEASEIANVSEQTVRFWCRRFKIGEMSLGRWCIDPSLLGRLLADWSGATEG